MSAIPRERTRAAQNSRLRDDVSICWRGLVVAEAVDPAVAECAMRYCDVESVEATNLCEADLGKAPKNLFANEPSLSVQGTGGSCGS